MLWDMHLCVFDVRLSFENRVHIFTLVYTVNKLTNSHAVCTTITILPRWKILITQENVGFYNLHEFITCSLSRPSLCDNYDCYHGISGNKGG